MSKCLTQKLVFIFLGFISTLAIIPVILIFVPIFIQGSQVISWEFLTQMPRQGMRAGGIYPAIIGTIYLIFGTGAVALPLGVGSAIYLAEYAPVKLARVVRLAVVNLSGVPSVVYGLFGLGIFVLFLGFGSSLLAGSLTLGILILPVVITTSEEAILSVPRSFREASLALGATKWQTIRNVVLPAALPGILTGIILGIGRAAGETAPVMFTAAAFFLPRLPNSPFDQVMVLPYHLYVISTQVPNMADDIKYGTAFTLLALVLSINLVAILIRSTYRRKKKW